MTITEAMIKFGLAVTHGEVRRKCAEGAVRINGVRCEEPKMVLKEGEQTISLGRKMEVTITVH